MLRYPCQFCQKDFATPQARGGHQSDLVGGAHQEIMDEIAWRMGCWLRATVGGLAPSVQSIPSCKLIRPSSRLSRSGPIQRSQYAFYPPQLFHLILTTMRPMQHQLPCSPRPAIRQIQPPTIEGGRPPAAQVVQSTFSVGKLLVDVPVFKCLINKPSMAGGLPCFSWLVRQGTTKPKASRCCTKLVFGGGCGQQGMRFAKMGVPP